MFLAGSSVITVDSTVGFGSTGIVVSGINTNIYYSSKSLNQFFGCENIVYHQYQQQMILDLIYFIMVMKMVI